MEISDLIQNFIDVLEDHKAVNLVVFDVRGKSTLADYYLFCSGSSDPHIRALMNNLIKEIKDKHGVLPRGQEGQPHSHWVLLDYADILVNILHPEARARYAIESLHKDKIILYPGSDWEFPEQQDLTEEELQEVRDKVPEFLQ